MVSLFVTSIWHMQPHNCSTCCIQTVASLKFRKHSGFPTSKTRISTPKCFQTRRAEKWYNEGKHVADAFTGPARVPGVSNCSPGVMQRSTAKYSTRNGIKAKIATLRELTRHVAFFCRYIQIRFPLLEKTFRFAQKEAIARRSNLRFKDQHIISCLLYAKVTGSLSKLLKREHFSGKTGEFPP
jgi:hypothetical protein